MKLIASLSTIEEYTKIIRVYYGFYKIVVYDEFTGNVIVNYSNYSPAYDRIQSDLLSYQFGTDGLTLKQAYTKLLSVKQISVLNSIYRKKL